MKFLGNKNGFTLMEIIVALLLILILIAITNTVFIQGLNTYHRNRDKAEVAENLRVGMNRLSRELRQAKEIPPLKENPGKQLHFINANDDIIRYYISTSGDDEKAKQLTRAINNSGYNPVARYVNGIQIKPHNTGADTQVVTITLTGAKGRSGIMTVTTTIRLRL